MIPTIRPRKGFKLSTIISFVVIMSVIITLVISTRVGYHAEKTSLFNNTIELNQISATNLSNTTQSLIDEMRESLSVTASYFSDVPLTDEAVLSQLDFFMGTSPYFNSLSIADSNGVIISTSPNNLGLIGSKLTSAAARQALEQKKPLISEPYLAMTKRMIVLVSHPIFDSKGEYRGFVGGSIYLQQKNIFQNILGVQEQNSSGSYYYVVDASGKLIFHPNKERIAEVVSENPVVKKLMAGEAGQQKVTNSEGITFLAGYAPVASVGWGIVSQTPVDYVAITAQNVIKQMLLFSAPFLIILLIASLWLSRMLAEPLNRLANYASHLSHGDDTLMPLPPVVFWNYEANQLNNTVALAFNKLRQKTAELSLEAQTDPLTGLMNRRTLNAITALWQEEQVPFSIIMMDLDHFKSVNDVHGHHMGDEVLRALAEILQSEKRDSDYCCRYGGEEFTMLLPHTTSQEAYLAAERIRSRMENAITPISQRVTLSLGVATYPVDAEELTVLFSYADKALYQAKHEGRNRTVIHSKMNALLLSK
ncbi:sensor domain-containing diguanylate cyclase [Paenibacillus radicis (ex Gao et al. 2016)]|uniref:Cell signaling regulator n=1 Tax=Paenibacillus radicis (ex Gao et al. 2016) TaxID=1737354 RepID=A0A917H3W7_9BACL|nr:sensor domain-containing diguanylate cyclase [Paenibacillus radicis (ex Gao et al. 2016)]GGG66361.1 cell signaling regulator [Paenibacillus radicis (ex Gao et al. 2016)]